MVCYTRYWCLGDHALRAVQYTALYSAAVEVVVYTLELLNDMHRILLYMLEVVEKELCLLEELEVMSLCCSVCWGLCLVNVCWRC